MTIQHPTRETIIHEPEIELRLRRLPQAQQKIDEDVTDVLEGCPPVGSFDYQRHAP